MIFFDQSGKRWKRVKRLTVAIAGLSLIPVLALVAGSLAYQPKWGVLPFIEQAGAVLSGNIAPQSTAPKPSTGPASPSSRPASRTTQATPVQLAVLVSGASAAAATPTPVTTTGPAASPAPSPTPTPKGNPTKNDFGQSHKPSH